MAKKKGESHIRNKIDFYIGNYVYDKKEVKKARSYSKGIRNNSDYAFLEDNYGVGTPSSIKFSPLISLRMNILKGILLSGRLDHQVMAVDRDTVEQEAGQYQDLQKKMAVEIINEGMKSNNPEATIKQIQDKYDKEFVSSFQSAAQHIISNFVNGTDFRMREKEEAIFDELLISGEFVLREKPIIKGTVPEVEICPSEDIFFTKNKNTTDIGTSDAIVFKRYMTKRQVIMELGGYMNEKDKEEFLKDQDINANITSATFERDYGIDRFYYDSQYLSDELYDIYYKNLQNVVEVYHVQYKDVETRKKDPQTFDERMMALLGKYKKKTENIEVLYEGYRVGTKYYLNLGKKLGAKRDYKDFRKVEFDYAGFSLNTFRGRPVSMIYDLIDLQDMTDILIFHRENLVALSGVRGSRVNLAAIPKAFGPKLMDRIKVFKALKKNGDEFYDFTQEGAEKFQQAGDYNNSLDNGAVTAINGILQSFEYQADAVTGINANMRGQIEQREAVSNVRTGIKMISYATKKYYSYTDRGMEMVLTSMLNGVKRAYPDGYSGVYYVGKNKKSFSLAPSNYTLSTFVLSIRREDEDTIDLEKLRATINEFAVNGIIDPRAAIEGLMTDSKQELEEIVLNGLDKKEKENNQIGKMNEQMQQMAAQIEELNKLNEQISKENENYKKRAYEIEERKVAAIEKKSDNDHDIKIRKLIIDEEVEKGKLREIAKRTDIEKLEAEAGGNAKEVKNII